MDITTIAVADTAAIHLKDAKGEPLFDANSNPVRIHVYGPGSKQFAAVEARQSARALKRMQDNDGKATVAPPEQRAKEHAEDLAAITARFENLTYPPAGDKQGAELFEALYLDRSLGFVGRQVTKFVDDWGNFSGGSANS
jgi:hypothetical protein